jgi:hypothetical protein
MALALKPIPASQGARWVRDGFALFSKKPLAFSALFVMFFIAVVLVSVVPLLGPMLTLALLPLLSLGFMVGAESALAHGPVHPGQYLDPFKRDAPRRRSLITLCVGYGVVALLLMLVCDWADGGSFERWQRLMAQGEASQAEMDALLADPRLSWGVVLRIVGVTLLSIPFWHAPALVHWGGQGAAQALFSSTLAVWRSKGAFVTYALTWLAMMIAFGLFTGAMFWLMGASATAGVLVLPAALIFSTVFYVSLIFTFNDSFGHRAGAEA